MPGATSSDALVTSSCVLQVFVRQGKEFHKDLGDPIVEIMVRSTQRSGARPAEAGIYRLTLTLMS